MVKLIFVSLTNILLITSLISLLSNSLSKVRLFQGRIRWLSCFVPSSARACQAQRCNDSRIQHCLISASEPCGMITLHFCCNVLSDQVRERSRSSTLPAYLSVAQQPWVAAFATPRSTQREAVVPPRNLHDR
jgi:hypothetical protein